MRDVQLFHRPSCIYLRTLEIVEVKVAQVAFALMALIALPKLSWHCGLFETNFNISCLMI